jgi:hypothetical protein
MANSLLTVDMITREALRVAHETCQFIGTTDRQYDSSFARTGAKIGDTLRVRKPNQYLRRQGSRVMDVKDQNEQSGTITVATQDGVDMRFNSAELALDIDNFSKLYIEPAIKTLVSGIEADYLAYATKATANLVGTAGTPITTLAVPGAARAKLNQQLAPKDSNRFIQMDSVTMAGLVNGMAAYFNPSKDGSDRFREGLVARTAMADYYENERTGTLPNAGDVAGEINAGTLTSGITSLTVDGLTVAPVAGMVFTIEGTYDVHPETKVAYPHLKQFVCSSGCTTTNLVFTPAVIYDTTDPRQNCSGAPTNDDNIVFEGAASTNYVQPLMYHKDAFQFVTADLPIMADAAKCVRRSQDGLSLRVWEGSDIRNDELLMRIDILYGMSALRPEWACRMIGAAG